LRVPVEAEHAIWILGPGRGLITDLLREIPRGFNIWEPEAERHLAADGPAALLWRALRTHRWPAGEVKRSGFGRTRTSKLLAAKRPTLLPIWDSEIKKLGSTSDTYWTAWREALTEEAVEDLNRVAHAAALLDVPRLRIADIIVWKHYKDNGGLE
jgi:hypothetical protein